MNRNKWHSIRTYIAYSVVLLCINQIRSEKCLFQPGSFQKYASLTFLNNCLSFAKLDSLDQIDYVNEFLSNMQLRERGFWSNLKYDNVKYDI